MQRFSGKCVTSRRKALRLTFLLMVFTMALGRTAPPVGRVELARAGLSTAFYPDSKLTSPDAEEVETLRSLLEAAIATLFTRARITGAAHACGRAPELRN
jgi:hypothetical protein